jgi:hypothetical protein
MNKEQFEELFDEFVSEPLKGAGFIRKGTSLYCVDGITQVALRRGGGRLSGPGTISFIVCFRHTFLRDKYESIPKVESILPECCPWVFGTDSIINGSFWQFDPSKLMSLPYERLVYDRKSDLEITSYFQNLELAVTSKFLPWALAKTPESALSDMSKYTEKWWVARLWAEDYKNYLNSASN